MPHHNADTRRDIRAGIADSGPVGFGYIPLGMAFGVLLVQAGLAWWWAPVFSVLIYGGSLQFLAIGLVTAATPLASIAVTSFLVQFRHIFYGLSFPLSAIRSRAGKVYAVYALTDEAYAIVATKGRELLSGARVLAISMTCHALWITGSTLGALLGTALPPGLDGLQFALTALFAVLAVDAWRASGDLPSPVIALVCALVAVAVAPGQMLVVGLGLFLAALTVRYVVARRRGAAVPGEVAP